MQREIVEKVEIGNPEETSTADDARTFTPISIVIGLMCLKLPVSWLCGPVLCEPKIENSIDLILQIIYKTNWHIIDSVLDLAWTQGKKMIQSPDLQQKWMVQKYWFNQFK